MTTEEFIKYANEQLDKAEEYQKTHVYTKEELKEIEAFLERCDAETGPGNVVILKEGK